MEINRLRYYFVFCNREYIFRDKKLFQQPYNNNLRWFNEREIKQKANGYYLQGLYITIDYIKKSLKKKEFIEYVEDTTPF